MDFFAIVACPVQFFAEEDRSGFNRGLPMGKNKQWLCVSAVKKYYC